MSREIKILMEDRNFFPIYFLCWQDPRPDLRCWVRHQARHKKTNDRRPSQYFGGMHLIFLTVVMYKTEIPPNAMFSWNLWNQSLDMKPVFTLMIYSQEAGWHRQSWSGPSTSSWFVDRNCSLGEKEEEVNLEPHPSGNVVTCDWFSNVTAHEPLSWKCSGFISDLV